MQSTAKQRVTEAHSNSRGQSSSVSQVVAAIPQYLAGAVSGSEQNVLPSESTAQSPPLLSSAREVLVALVVCFAGSGRRDAVADLGHLRL